MDSGYDSKAPITGGYLRKESETNKAPSRSTTLDTESRLFDPSVIATLRSQNYKRVRKLSGGSKLSNYYYIGSELRICNDGKKASDRPVLRNIIDRATGEPKVLKIISKNRIPQSQEGLANWRRLCEKLMNMGRYNNVMRIDNVYESDSSFYTVTEKLGGGELFEFLLREKAIPEDICKYIMRQILHAVHVLHSNNLLHRDIKPENIVFRHPTNSKLPVQDRYELVLIDFDTCKMTNSATADKLEIINGKRRLVGTYGYLAPEIWHGEDYSTASDLWSVGIVLYILMTGVPPVAMDKMFDAKSSHMVLTAAEANGLDFSMPPLMEFPLATDLCKRLLCFDRKRRINSAADALAHPWLADLPGIFNRGTFFTHRGIPQSLDPIRSDPRGNPFGHFQRPSSGNPSQQNDSSAAQRGTHGYKPQKDTGYNMAAHLTSKKRPRVGQSVESVACAILNITQIGNANKMSRIWDGTKVTRASELFTCTTTSATSISGIAHQPAPQEIWE
ncbi:bifunctional Protein kinase domain/Protein kinase-like domain superfamily/Serine-threonine-protein kinase [Babesia duncani]|uniref:Bifunctional Protein kinase domain/Protein kinase-like domain superfamily/Serine-threonine-protein kinase n=1 Tax=Babesia duncani TaxID=323732 RepID=A0AAD9UP79_9APIC|nr:bifunctional Protein kinase domain/Protein kinase-like domain superfamily/Serine-threonine-protein kinase [Babesia duncani]